MLKNELMPIIEKIVDEASFIMGSSVEEFEQAFAKFCGKKYAIGLNSGTDALKLALVAYGIGAGDEVITVPNSYFSTAMVISTVGARPVFIDIDPDTSLMDFRQIEKAVSPRTRAILPVHLYGQAADMDPIFEIARKYNLFVIEDSCQAHGAEYKGKKVPVGETGAFSFYPGKNLGCFGDGGALVTDNDEIYNKLLFLRNDGSRDKYIHETFGMKSRLDALQAAILNSKLPNLEHWNDERWAHAQKYKAVLSQIGGIKLPKEALDRRHVYHLFVVECSNRDQLRSYLLSHGIETGIHYPVPIHLQEPYNANNAGLGKYPVTEAKAKRILSLPMFPELTDKEIFYVAEKLREFIEVVPHS